MDDLSDETARRRVFRGIHRALNPVEDPSGSPRPDEDAVSLPVTAAIDTPHRGFVGADDHETFGAGFVQPGAYHDAEPDPYPDLAPRQDSLEAEDLLAPDPFASDADRTGAWSTGGDTFFSARARHAAPPPRDPAPSTRSVPPIPLPGVQDDLRGPAAVFGLRGSALDLTDTLADAAPHDVAPPAQVRWDSVIPPLPEAGSPEPAFTLSYDVETPAAAPENPSHNHGRPRADGEPAAGRFGPAAGHRDGEAEPPESDISADRPGPSQEVRTSDHPRRPPSKLIACAAALAPILAVSAMLYAQPDILKRLEDIAGRPRSEAAVKPDDDAPAAPPSSAPRSDAQPAGEAPPPASEIEARLKGRSVGIPKLVSDPLPILTAIPSAAATPEPESGVATAPGSDLAPGARTPPTQGVAGPPPGVSPVPEAAPTPSGPDAEAPAPKAPRSAARRARARLLTPDDALTVKAERLLAAGDILAARTLFQNLVAAGDPRGARGVAQTFDPRVLDRFPASGVKPDPAEAARWQAIAARLETRQRRPQGEAAQ